MFLNRNILYFFDSGAKMTVAAQIIKPGFVMSGRELAKLCGVSHSRVIEILKEFEKINFVTSRRVGKTVVWTAKTSGYAYITAEKLFGSRQLFKPVTHLKNMIKESLENEHVKRAVLFGSAAEGTEKQDSDIDLFVLVENAGKKKNAERLLEALSGRCTEVFGNTLHYYVLTESEYRKKEGLALIKNIENGKRII